MGQQVFNFTGAGQLFVVPAGVNTINVDLRGGISGAALGGRATGVIPCYPGQVFWIGVGGNGHGGSGSTGGAGGWPNGGQGGVGALFPGGHGGGGATTIRHDNVNGTIAGIAGGAGGKSGDNVQGGNGGGTNGALGALNPAGGTGGNSASGGTQTEGGLGGQSPAPVDGGNGSSGILGQGGAGGGALSGVAHYGGGGGGGGYRSGGGGRGSLEGQHTGAGGGGGSGYSGGLLSPWFGTTQGVEPSLVVIGWTDPVVPPPPLLVPIDIEINGLPEQDELGTNAVGVFNISAVLSQSSEWAEQTGRLLIRLSTDASFSVYDDYYTGWGPVTEDGNRRTIATAPLAHSTRYYVRAWSQNSQLLYSTSYNSTNFWTNRKPNPPELLTPVENLNLPSGLDITFTWDSNDKDPDLGPGELGQAGYELQYREQRQITDATGRFTTLERPVNTSETITLDADRFNGATFYEWRMRIHDAQGFWSDWSLLQSFFVVSGVKPPLLIQPINDEAVYVDQVVKFRWKFRDPDGDALQKTDLRYRAVGAADWTNDFAAGPSTLLYKDYPAGTFTAGLEYEWQARTYDDTSTESEWTFSETFWAINTPGAQAHAVPLYIGDQKELGQGIYRVFVYAQGGQQIIGEITNQTMLRYRRVRDDISNCTVVYNGTDDKICELLGNIRCWMHEIVVFRNSKRVWEGPITRTTYNVDSVEVEAQDVMAYLYRRIMRQGYNDSYRLLTIQDDTTGGVLQIQTGLNTVVERAMRIIVNGLAPHDLNILPYLTRFDYEDDARQSRVVPDYATTCWQEVDDLAATAGLDYTVVGRRIILNDTHRPIGRLPQMSNGDFSEPPIVSEYGMQLANYYAVTNGNGVWGHARPFAEGQNNEFYGPVELLTSAYGETDAGPEEVLTVAAREQLIETLEKQAARGIASRWPTPLVVRVPDNATLNPHVEVGFDQLIPGVWIPLIASGTCRSVEQWQKLDEVTVDVSPAGETVQVVMSPAPNGGGDPDTAESEESTAPGFTGPQNPGLQQGVHEGVDGEVTVVTPPMQGVAQFETPVGEGNQSLVYAVPMVGYGQMVESPSAFSLDEGECVDLADAEFVEVDGKTVGWYNPDSDKLEGLPPFAAVAFYFPDVDAALNAVDTFKFTIGINVQAPFTVGYVDPDGVATTLRTYDVGAPSPLQVILTPTELAVVAANPGGHLVFQATNYNKVSSFCWKQYPAGDEVFADCFDAAAAEFNYNIGDPGNPFGEVVGTEIHALNGSISAYFPDHPLTEFDRGKTYKFTITFGAATPAGNHFVDVLSYASNTPASWGAGGGIYIGTNDDGDYTAYTQTVTIGLDSMYYPDWNTAPEGWEGLSFETYEADDIIESICWEDVSPDAPGVHVVELPATIVSADSGYSNGPSVLYTKGTSAGSTTSVTSRSVVTGTTSSMHVKYGTGSNTFNWTPPVGAVIDSIEYVCIGYREADVPITHTPSAWSPVPTENPFFGLAGDGRSELLAFPELTVTTDMNDVIDDELIITEPDIDACIIDDNPMNLFSTVHCNDSLSGTCRATYLAARVTYTIP